MDQYRGRSSSPAFATAGDRALGRRVERRHRGGTSPHLLRAGSAGGKDGERINVTRMCEATVEQEIPRVQSHIWKHRNKIRLLKFWQASFTMTINVQVFL